MLRGKLLCSSESLPRRSLFEHCGAKEQSHQAAVTTPSARAGGRRPNPEGCQIQPRPPHVSKGVVVRTDFAQGQGWCKRHRVVMTWRCDAEMEKTLVNMNMPQLWLQARASWLRVKRTYSSLTRRFLRLGSTRPSRRWMADSPQVVPELSQAQQARAPHRNQRPRCQCPEAVALARLLVPYHGTPCCANAGRHSSHCPPPTLLPQLPWQAEAAFTN